MQHPDRHLDDDRLVHLGLHGTAGADRGTVEHLAACSDCSASVDEIAGTIRLGGVDVVTSPDGPPAAMWDRIAAEITTNDHHHTSDPDNTVVSTRGIRTGRGARWIAAAAVVGGLVGAGVTAVVLSAGSAEPPASADTVATAALAVPVGAGTASGTAELINEDGRWTLVVDTRGLNSGSGYFEVWLLDAAGRMYALGALPEGSTARLAVPDGISVAEFNVVDISAQQFNGDPSHSRDSVLRGTLRD